MILGSEYVKKYVFFRPSFGSCQFSSNPGTYLQFLCMNPVTHFRQATICNCFAGIWVCCEREIKQCIHFQNSDIAVTSQLLCSTTLYINIFPSLIMTWCSCKLLSYVHSLCHKVMIFCAVTGPQN